MLQEIIVQDLAVDEKGGGLSVHEIEVRFREPGTHDVNYSDLMIEVFAGWFSSRADNVIERTYRISQGVKESKLLPPEVFGGSNFVWVFLAEAGFAYI